MIDLIHNKSKFHYFMLFLDSNRGIVSFFPILDSHKGISLKWVDNYNINFMTVLRTDGLRCPKVRGFDLFVNVQKYQRYCRYSYISLNPGVFSNFTLTTWSTPQTIWAAHGGFQLHNNCIRSPTTIQNDAQETSISIFNINSEAQPSALPTMETNVQPSAPVMKLDLPPSYDEVMNKH